MTLLAFAADRRAAMDVDVDGKVTAPAADAPCSSRSISPARARPTAANDTIRYDTRCYFNVRSKADISQLNLPHGTDN